jgi:ribose 5-phosphate isomerase B
MRIAIGSDHAGFNLKKVIINLLSELGHSWEDFGCYNENSVDYPDFGEVVAKAVARGDFEQGILICSTGIGMSMVANKIPGIRAALCHDTFSAHRAREHNDANILCLGGWITGKGLACEIVATYLKSEFSGEQRHVKRLEKMQVLESLGR